MDLRIVAMLLATRAPELLLRHSTIAPPAERAAVDAQTPSAPDSVARVLLRLEDDWAVGLIKRDTSLFRRLLADGFVYTEDDRTVGRDAVLNDIVAGPDTVETAHNEEMKVYEFGATAIVTGWLIVGGRGIHGPFSRRYRFTDTWVRRGGGWQIVGAHDYLVTSKAHHHPRGAKIMMRGTIVHPLCAFAHQMPDSAQARCSQQHPSGGLAPVLVADDELYLLAFDHAGATRVPPTDSLVGKPVKVDGTVYPAGSSYLIVVDSLRSASTHDSVSH